MGLIQGRSTSKQTKHMGPEGYQTQALQHFEVLQAENSQWRARIQMRVNQQIVLLLLRSVEENGEELRASTRAQFYQSHGIFI